MTADPCSVRRSTDRRFNTRAFPGVRGKGMASRTLARPVTYARVPPAKAGMRNRAVAPEVAVPGVVLLVDAALGHAAVQHVEPLLALAAADDLADSRRQYVHRRGGAAVVVEPHVERLDGPW